MDSSFFFQNGVNSRPIHSLLWKNNKEEISMYGYPGSIRVEDVVKEQEELLKNCINEFEQLIEEQKKELKKLEELLFEEA